MAFGERILGITHTYAPSYIPRKWQAQYCSFLTSQSETNAAVLTYRSARPISCQKGGRCGSGSQTEKAEFTRSK